MKNWLLAALLIPATTVAQNDTTWVQSHQNTHWDWAGSWFDTVQFPTTGTYRKILMHYTLGCPSIGCSEWDYTTHIDVGDPINDTTTLWFELVRIITPYAGNKGSTWKHEWVIDVTDYAPLLTGERSIAARYSGYQDGFTVSIDFEFIEGTPAREVLDVNQIYHGTYRYGFETDPIESHLVPVDVEVDANMESAKFRMVASGHSFGGNENCAEFCQKYYSLYVNGEVGPQNYVWRDDCGSNVLEAQTGTWIYERAGWCPGAEALRYDDEVGAMLTAGQTNELNVDWEEYTYTGGAGFDPQYYLESILFQYGAWSHSVDASIDQVLKPSTADQQSNVNPICNNPQIVVSNTGATNISSIDFEFWTEGAPQIVTHTWTGVLKPAESETITLSSSSWFLFEGHTAGTFHVEIVGVNGAADGYDANNHYASAFNTPPVFPAQIVVQFTNNNTNNETSYRITNDAGEVIYSRSQADALTTYYDTIDLATGCYRMVVNDDDCDGLKFFANSDGNGKVWLHDAASFFPPIHQFEDEFGCNTELQFTVGYELGAGETEAAVPNVYVYPNPSNGEVLIGKSGDAPAGLLLHSADGRLVRSINSLPAEGITISGLEPGIYVASLTGSVTSTVRFVVVN